ncbi:hypothetical protein FS749_003345 [Ceratobasidium sp. UAMH 11750]|nr:hypothetical protein FS749_003345 [Ceratobasidium sp. UAMH 11750]
MRWLLSSLLLGSLHLASATLQVIPGATWISSGNNQTIQAHGGGITKVGDTFYWIGEDKTGGWPFYAINCYSSKNLVEWTFVKALFTRQDKGEFGPNRIVERPKVIYNTRDKLYVMWMHIDDYPEYSEGKVGVATSSSVCGDYTLKSTFQPGGFPSRDMTVFKDTDGRAYLVTEQREAKMTAIYLLSPNYQYVLGLKYKWDEQVESPAMMKTMNGVYFMFTSSATYWRPNDNRYSTSTRIEGPWSPWKVCPVLRISSLQTFAPEKSLTFRSQTTFILPFDNFDRFMFMGGMFDIVSRFASERNDFVSDRWDGRDHYWEPQYMRRSTYVWLPLEIDGTTASMLSGASWVPKIERAALLPLRNETWYQAENASISGSATIISCQDCSGGQGVGWVGGSGKGAVTFTNVMSDSGGRTTLRIETMNGDREFRDTTMTTGNFTYTIPVFQLRNMMVTVNGVSRVIPVLPSDSGQQPQPLALHVDLQSGSNTITISGSGDEYAPDIDAIVLGRSGIAFGSYPPLDS